MVFPPYVRHFHAADAIPGTGAPALTIKPDTVACPLLSIRLAGVPWDRRVPDFLLSGRSATATYAALLKESPTRLIDQQLSTGNPGGSEVEGPAVCLTAIPCRPKSEARILCAEEQIAISQPKPRDWNN